MKPLITSRELEARYRKAKCPIVAEISGELTAQARTAHIQAFANDAKRKSPKKSILLIALDG